MIKVVSQPIDRQEVLASFAPPDCGAVSVFEGVVRANSHNKVVTHLVYEAYEPMAVKEIDKICRRASEEWPVRNVSVVHRVGRLEIGEVAVLVAVASPHRAAAFDSKEVVMRLERLDGIEDAKDGRASGLNHDGVVQEVVGSCCLR